MNSNAELQAALYALFNQGKMPIEIRMSYPCYCAMMKNDEEFGDIVELPDADRDKPTYQSLPIVFDSWHNKPFIKSEPINKGEWK